MTPKASRQGKDGNRPAGPSETETGQDVPERVAAGEDPSVVLDVESILAAIGATRSWVERPTTVRTQVELGRMLRRLMEEIHPAAIVAVVAIGQDREDQAGVAGPDPQAAGLDDRARRLLDDLGILVVEVDGTGKRDLLAALARRLRFDRPVVIVSADTHLDQLVSDRVRIAHPDLRRLAGPLEIEAKWGVPPALVPDFLALAGDPPSDLPGVKGIGVAEARRLLHDFGSLDALIAGANTVKPNRLGEAIAAGAAQARKVRDRALPKERVLLPPALALPATVPTAEQVTAVFQLPGSSDEKAAPIGPSAVRPDPTPDIVTPADLDAVLAAAVGAGRLLIDVVADGSDPMCDASASPTTRRPRPARCRAKKCSADWPPSSPIPPSRRSGTM
jgi:hypothetical protein